MDMEENSFEWKDEYCIGVDVVDQAHERLFKIVSRIINNFGDKDFEKSKTTCLEAIKYLKSYAVKHFAEEEAYQIKIGYSGYKVHKRIHDNMKNVVIPALEREVECKGYSKESLEHFAGACAGWLAAHVLVEDRAITGKAKSKWTRDAADSTENALDGIIRGYSSSLFNLNAELFSKNYAGYKLGSLFCYNDIIQLADGTEYSIMTALEESVLDVIGRRLVHQEVIELDSVMLPLFSEVMKSFNSEVALAMLNQEFKSVKSGAVPPQEFYAQYEKQYPDYSMLWRTYCGYIAFTAKKIPMRT